MLDVNGPLSGQFSEPLQPVDGDVGVLGPCMGGELVVEFQSRAVLESTSLPRRYATNETTWTLATDIEVSWC
jgi:hypothetical protein